MNRPPRSRLALLPAAHFTVDAYSCFLLPLLPLLVTRLDLNLARVGWLMALSSITSSLLQPLFGMWSDRLRRPWFVVLGPLIAAMFMSAVGLAPSFAALAALVMLGGLGAAAFHPQAAALAGSLSDRRAIALSFFVTGGTLGFSLGPLYAVSVVDAVGLGRSWLAILPGLAVAGLLLVWFTRVGSGAGPRTPPASLAALRPVWRPLALIYLAGVSRSAVSFGLQTFLPLLLHRRGFSVSAGGAILTVYLASGAVGPVGVAADAFGLRTALLALSVLLPVGLVCAMVLPRGGVPGGPAERAATR